MATVVGIISRHGITIDSYCRNQPNKSKLAFYKLLLYFNSQLLSSDKMGRFNCKGGCGIHVSRHLKEELAWARDNSFGLLLFKTFIPLRN